MKYKLTLTCLDNNQSLDIDHTVTNLDKIECVKLVLKIKRAKKELTQGIVNAPLNEHDTIEI